MNALSAYLAVVTVAGTVALCWPARERDDDCIRCGECDVLWTSDRVCPFAGGDA